jgi:transposase
MSETTDSGHDWSQDLKSRVKQFTQPIVDSLDSRLRDQVDRRVDQRVEEQMDEKIDAALKDLAVVERAIADLDRALRELEARPKP